VGHPPNLRFIVEHDVDLDEMERQTDTVAANLRRSTKTKTT
jgi:hypothetical protein